MQFSIQNTYFSSTLAAMQSIINTHNSMPILNNVMIKTLDNETISIHATDLSIALTITIPATITLPGTITLSAKKLFEITCSLPKESLLSITIDNNIATITSGKAIFKIFGLPADNFPQISTIDSLEHQLDQEHFYALIKKTYFAIASDSSRQVFNGINVKVENRNLVITATDGHKLAIITAETHLPDLNIIIPDKACKEILKLPLDPDCTFTMKTDTSKIHFSIGDYSLIANLIEGTYPNMEKAIPENTHTLSINRKQLIDALKRITIFSDVITNGVKFSLSATSITLSSADVERGEATETFAIEYDGPEFDIGFNAKYVLDIITKFDSETIIIKLNDPMSSVTITNQEEPHYTCLVMPMRI